MAADGIWNVLLATKLGSQELTITLATQGSDLTGLIESPMGDVEIQGEVTGNLLIWDMKITKPMPMKARYEVTVEGDKLTGFAKLGLLGKAKVTGERILEKTKKSDSKAPTFITEKSIDPRYNDPYIETDEWRDAPSRHRYVQGAFKGTGARFSFYFPPKEQYQGRFFHNTYPLALTSDVGPFPIPFDVATGDLGFTFDSGAYYVQTNLGGSDRAPMADPAIAAYRVNAAAAKFSRNVAAEMYGQHRPFGYLFGGSGGSYQTLGSAENTAGVWDGFVPFVMGSANSIPSMFTIRLHALRVLRKRNKFPDILDAINPGGSSDPYATLNSEEAAALKEATLMGFPPQGWYSHETMTSGYFSHIAPLVPLMDPEYIDDFWSQTGYLGTDPEANLSALRFQFETSITRCIDGFLKGLELASVPDRDFADAHLVVLSGESQGHSIPIAEIEGLVIRFQLAADQSAISGIRPGDRVSIDNSWALALQTYHRHQVPGTDLCGWNQYRDTQGQPIYPQRKILLGALSTAGTAGSALSGNIHGKMLVVEAMMDIDALAWQADWYRSLAQEQLAERFAENYAIWFIEHAQHDNPQTPEACAHSVSMGGALQQALRDISAWVEEGKYPSSTQYEIVDSQVQVPASAAQRRGIQPVVALQVNNGERADVKCEEAVHFTATIDVPENTGTIVAVEWDFNGEGSFPTVTKLVEPVATLACTESHSYVTPGTYFPVVRVTSQRSGDAATPYGRIQNIARVRVVVTA